MYEKTILLLTKYIIDESKLFMVFKVIAQKGKHHVGTID